ncbi:MAG: DUF5011 domain-containing protein [Lachnospiraceae bacterium]|nr:DUF5011 domain-containing protein [Lachnospiraceae bacterium]
MNENRKNGNLILVLMVSLLILGLVFTAAFIFSRNAEDITPTPSPIEKEDTTPSPTTSPTATPIPDQTAPVVTTKRVIGSYGVPVNPEDFIELIEDETDCTVVYLVTPDFEKYGAREIQLVVSDTAGNMTTATAVLNILNVVPKVELHLGTPVPFPEEFLITEGSTISYVTDISLIDVTVPGEYGIDLMVDGDAATAVLSISDRKAPVVTTKDAVTWLNKKLKTEDFIVDVSDDTEVSVEFSTEPKWDTEGEQKVQLVVTDAQANKTIAEAKLTVQKDTKAPTLSVTDIDVVVGGTVSYKKAMNYVDDIDTKTEMKVEIDRSSVDLDKVGTYEVIYSVTDCSGNKTTVTGKINVVEEAPKWADEDAIHEKADSILAGIINDGMTDREKAKAIYRWLKNNIGYISHSEKGNYMRGAYEGLFKKQGDCFVYAASAKELLTRAGLQNLDIVKATTNPSHYWNLVWVEDGWYHFDSTPRKDKSEFFLLTDAELEAYSSTHKNTHIFDRSLYPEIK